MLKFKRNRFITYMIMITKSIWGFPFGFFGFFHSSQLLQVVRCNFCDFRSYSVYKTELFEHQVKKENYFHLSSYVYMH